MDLNELAMTKADEGIEYELRDLSGSPTGIFITLIGSDSGEYQDFVRKCQNRRLQARRYSSPSVEELDNISLKALCHVAIKKWRTNDKETLTFGGEELKCTPENAMKVFGDIRLRDLREQCQDFIDNRKNFL